MPTFDQDFSDLPSIRFGVEIECIGLGATRAVAALTEAGLDAYDAGYTHETSRRWKIVSDSSLHGPRPCEVVSPILQGAEGLRDLLTVLNTLRRKGARVNSSCGIHVHIDAAGFQPEELVNILRRYSAFEETITSFMPRSRRNNYYSRSIRGYYRLDGVDTLESFRRLARRSDRYLNVNLQAYLRHGTLEFRQHGGSLSAEKVGNWVRFLLHFVEASKAQAPEVPAPAPTPAPQPQSASRRGPRSGEQASALKTILNRLLISRGLSNPLTDEDLCDGLRVSAGSLATYISKLRRSYGVNIRRDRRAGVYRINHMRGDDVIAAAFIALNAEIGAATPAPVPTPPPAPAPVIIPINRDAWDRGVPTDVRSALQERMMDLAA